MFKLPRPMLHSHDPQFSFQGLKTAVLTATKSSIWQDSSRADLAAEFQEAVSEVLVKKAVAALRQCGLKTLVVAGVGANRRLRERLNWLFGKWAPGYIIPSSNSALGQWRTISLAAGCVSWLRVTIVMS